MRLHAAVTVRRVPEDVAAFLGDLRNIPMWDRGVAEVRVPTNATPGVGFRFETLSHPGGGADDGRMAYEVSAVGAEGSTVRLTSTTGNAAISRMLRGTSDSIRCLRARASPAPPNSRCACAICSSRLFCF